MKTGNLSIELKSKAEIELFFFQIEIRIKFFFYFYCVAISIRLGHERKVNEENLRNNHELKGTIKFLNYY
jgi:hypothetical protein